MNEISITKGNRLFLVEDAGFKKNGYSFYDVFYLGTPEAQGTPEACFVFTTSLCVGPLEDLEEVAQRNLGLHD